MLETTDCSALENLAAFAEGKLRGSEREQLIAHLAECADCRELLAGIVETAEELDKQDRPATVVPLPPRPHRFGWPWRAASAAAIGAVAVGIVVFSQLGARRHPPSPSEWLAERKPPAHELAAHVWPGLLLHGSQKSNESVLRAAEVGALLVDLEVTLQAADVEGASQALERMAAITGDGTLESDSAALRRIAKERDAQRMRSAYAKLRPELEQHLRERFAPSVLDLGIFVEEAQIAASTADRTFLESPPARRYLDWLIARPQMALPMESDDSIPLPTPVQDAVRTLRRDGASSADQAAAAEDILATLSRRR